MFKSKWMRLLAIVITISMVVSLFAACAEEEPVETDPEQTTTPAETDPADTDPAETDPADTDPAETDPAETDPAETDPAETDPAGTDPVEDGSDEESTTASAGDDEETTTASAGGDDEENTTAPAGGDDEENTTAPAGGDDEENTTAPVGGDDEENTTAPAGGDDEENTTAPAGGDDEEVTTQKPEPDPVEMSITEALAAEDGTKVIIKGSVCKVNYNWSTDNMSVTIVDDAGATIYIYRLATEVRFGDKITVTGAVGTHEGSKQIAAGATATVDGQVTYAEKTIPEAKNTADNVFVSVKGVVKDCSAWDASYNNMNVTIVDGNGNELYIYRLATQVENGDYIVVNGVVGTYNSEKQIGEDATATVITKTTDKTNGFTAEEISALKQGGGATLVKTLKDGYVNYACTTPESWPQYDILFAATLADNPVNATNVSNEDTPGMYIGDNKYIVMMVKGTTAPIVWLNGTGEGELKSFGIEGLSTSWKPVVIDIESILGDDFQDGIIETFVFRFVNPRMFANGKSFDIQYVKFAKDMKEVAEITASSVSEASLVAYDANAEVLADNQHADIKVTNTPVSATNDFLKNPILTADDISGALNGGDSGYSITNQDGVVHYSAPWEIQCDSIFASTKDDNDTYRGGIEVPAINIGNSKYIAMMVKGNVAPFVELNGIGDAAKVIIGLEGVTEEWSIVAIDLESVLGADLAENAAGNRILQTFFFRLVTSRKLTATNYFDIKYIQFADTLDEIHAYAKVTSATVNVSNAGGTKEEFANAAVKTETVAISCVDADENCVCDVCGADAHVDTDGDYSCDRAVCGTILRHDCVYTGEFSAICIYCGKIAEHDHVDGDGNKYCDACEADMSKVTVTYVVADAATAGGWANESLHLENALDSVITMTFAGSGNTGKYFTSGNEFRMYQSGNTTMTFSAVDGYKIVSVKVTYTVTKNGVLMQNETQVASDEVFVVDAASVEFGVGNTGTATNGQVKITAVEVVYEEAVAVEADEQPPVDGTEVAPGGKMGATKIELVPGTTTKYYTVLNAMAPMGSYQFVAPAGADWTVIVTFESTTVVYDNTGAIVSAPLNFTLTGDTLTYDFRAGNVDVTSQKVVVFTVTVEGAPVTGGGEPTVEELPTDVSPKENGTLTYQVTLAAGATQKFTIQNGAVSDYTVTVSDGATLTFDTDGSHSPVDDGNPADNVFAATATEAWWLSLIVTNTGDAEATITVTIDVANFVGL